MRGVTIGLIACAVLAVTAAAACAVIAVMLGRTAPQATLPPPGPAPERTYDNKAYLFQDGRRFSEVPYFRIETNVPDQELLHGHLINLAIVRHWVMEETDYWTRPRFVMPDYDVAIIRELARDPDGWLAGHLAHPPGIPDLPPKSSLMAVDVAIVAPVDAARAGWMAGSILLGVAAFLAAVGVLGCAVELRWPTPAGSRP